MKHLALPLTLPLLAAACAAAAPRPVPRLTPPETKVQGYRFVVEQVQQQQYEQVEFPRGGQEGAVGKSSGRQHLFVRLAVHPPQPGMLPNIDGLDSKVLATAAGKSLALRGYPVDDGSPLNGGVWRHQLSAQEVDLGATHLSKLQGELLVYPKAQLVALDLPLEGKLPITKQQGGFRATLRSVKMRTGTLTVGVDIEWPNSLSVTRPNPESPTGVVALTRIGAPIIPNGGSSANQNREGFTARTHNLTFVDVKDLPEKLRVEALVRSGPVQRIPFTLPDIPLPDTLGAENETGDEEEMGPLEEGDPFYARGGGTVVAPVKSLATGRVLLGLARVEGGVAGPWRWLPTRAEKDRVLLTSIRPGKYRVARAWAPSLAAPSARKRLGDAQEIDLAAGQTVTLPAVEAPEAP